MSEDRDTTSAKVKGWLHKTHICVLNVQKLHAQVRFISVYHFCAWVCDWVSTPQEYGALPVSQRALCVCAHCPWTMYTKASLQLCLACVLFVYSTSFQVPLSAADHRDGPGLRKREQKRLKRKWQTDRQTDGQMTHLPSLWSKWPLWNQKLKLS